MDSNPESYIKKMLKNRSGETNFADYHSLMTKFADKGLIVFSEMQYGSSDLSILSDYIYEDNMVELISTSDLKAIDNKASYVFSEDKYNRMQSEVIEVLLEHYENHRRENSPHLLCFDKYSELVQNAVLNAFDVHVRVPILKRVLGEYTCFHNVVKKFSEWYKVRAVRWCIAEAKKNMASSSLYFYHGIFESKKITPTKKCLSIIILVQIQ